MSEKLPILPLKETVVYPDSMTPLVVNQERSIALINTAAGGDDRIVLVAAKTENVDDAAPADLYRFGTEALVHRVVRIPDGSLRALVQGIRRVKIKKYSQTDPFLIAEVDEAPDTGQDGGTEIEALSRQLLGTFTDIVEHATYIPDELGIVAANVDSPAELAHLIASSLRLKVSDKQRLLETLNLAKRMRLLLQLLASELEVLELGTKIQSEVHVEMSKTQRDWFLRQQLKQIHEELGDSEANEVAELRTQIEAHEVSDTVMEVVERELNRLARTPEQSAEYGVVRGYLDWIASLPWNTLSEDRLDIAAAHKVLDEDHFGLEKVKERILDYLAVSQLKHGDLSGPILCFVGPPGVGKTSLGRSIARALGREFARISVGGVRDESEIRGHRRTYVGAMPGSIIRSLRDAGTRNPVFMIDEIDKMGSDWRGDPSSAMLEVLDPEQNIAFRDHYLDLPFDLSRTLFVCTANRIDTIPSALLDRMEIIHLEGYTEEEKVAIARHYLVPRQRNEHGLKRNQLAIPNATLHQLVREYTREAGVRELERQVATVARKIARRVAEHGLKSIGRKTPEWAKVMPDELHDLLGMRKFQSDPAQRTQRPGVSTGLAVTSVGGDVLFVEAASMPGTGKLTITGQIGKVMEESARAAVSWLRTEAMVDDPDVGATFFAEHDLHIHVPAGSIPKDGPSAGIAIATALVSMLRGVPVRDDVAMTGEITLVGDVLPVGGIKQKALAAQRAGIKHVIIPELNEGALEEIPEHLARDIHFYLVDHVSQVLDFAIPKPSSKKPGRSKTRSTGRALPAAAATRNGHASQNRAAD